MRQLEQKVAEKKAGELEARPLPTHTMKLS
jgi:hypothetical protein